MEGFRSRMEHSVSHSDGRVAPQSASVAPAAPKSFSHPFQQTAVYGATVQAADSHNTTHRAPPPENGKCKMLFPIRLTCYTSLTIRRRESTRLAYSGSGRGIVRATARRSRLAAIRRSLNRERIDQRRRLH